MNRQQQQQRQRFPVRLPDWWPAFQGRINLYMVAGLLIVLGLVLLRFLPAEGLIGAGVLGAGLSVLVASVTGSQAVRQQYAAGANLLRKERYYAPVHAELRRLRGRLEEAAAGMAPYPMEVRPEPGPPVIAAGFNVVPFQEWTQIRHDSHANEFKLATQHALAVVEQCVLNYNEIIRESRAATLAILARHADIAATALAQNKDYLQWHQEELERRRSADTYVPPEQLKWYGAVDYAISMAAATTGSGAQTAGQLLAHWWLDSSRSLEGPNRAHLWLLAEQPKLAAEYVQGGYQSDMQSQPPPLDWLEPILDAVFAELRNNDNYQAAQIALENLLRATHTAERLLETGLRRIQELYEGGPPLV